MEGKRMVLDADVNRLYDAEMKKDSESSGHTVNSTRQTLSQGQGLKAKGLTPVHR